MQPMIPYYGGKNTIADWIISLLPPHLTYVEPFAGSLAVLFKKGRTKLGHGVTYNEAVNDSCGQIINMYRIAKDIKTRDEFISMCNSTLFSRADYDKSKALLKENTAPDMELAWAYYVNLCMSFGGKKDAGWSMATYKCKQAPPRTTSFRYRLDNLLSQCQRIESVFIECDDAINLIKRWDSPAVCFYCDPPYINTAQGHYKGYTEADFKLLIKTLDECQGSFVLSCYPNEFIPDHWVRHEKETLCIASAKSNSSKRTELAYVMDRSSNIEDRFKKILNINANQMDLFK